ncbi:MAG: 50S ribosomal protein L25 [Candidatus Pacebacteria bacterium]|nr:50S ribosomal protein L25 [Candidatus Paceibacterota bacterium]
MKLSFAKRLEEKKPDFIPAVVYGPGIENNNISINLKEFSTLFSLAGESTLISLESSDEVKYSVLVHEVQRDPLSGDFIHVDFYQPNLEKKVEVSVPITFTGIAPAVKDLGGTLVKNFLEVDVKALPQKLPHDIKVSVEELKTFDDVVTIKDLIVPEGVEILKDPEEIIALVTEAEKEEEMAPIEENVESVAKVEKKVKEEVIEE